ncbi:MAG TPA: hypothetical protein VM532_09210 [Burkholderiales bacterium]|nr:hypothetical protein [Burkholderiales bacterium]
MNDLQKQNTGPKFSSVSEAIGAASYVEQILASEQSWIINRLNWLLFFQSFCFTAYAILINSSAAGRQVMTLKIALPIVGALCSIAVALAIRAAEAVTRHLANERARITQYINSQTGTQIPLVGIDDGLRQSDIHATSWQGKLPHLLPWMFVPLWLLLLALTDF